VTLEGPWTVRQWYNIPGISHVLYTRAVGAKLSFTFEGRGLTLGFDFGTGHADFRWRLDDGEWTTRNMNRPEWVNAKGWARMVCLADDLPPGKHKVDMEFIHGDRERCTGTNVHLAVIGIVP
jgi:hypothetical protein